MNELIETDILIIGCGIAGSTTALMLADAGYHVTAITRTQRPEESNTHYAQGGIIFRGEEDSSDLLKEDIIRAGAGLSDPAAVDVLVTEGPGLVQEILLDRLAVAFDKNDDQLSLTREGSHSVARIIHSADATGDAIEKALLNAVDKHKNITLLTECTAVDLLTLAHHSLNRLEIYKPTQCVGAYILNQRDGKVIRCIAKKTVLATGGLGQVFLRTTNPYGARGDGLAMAYSAGARVLNCEFVQFHPTAFYHQDSARFLISEAVRGDGARLVNARGKPFMQKYDPKWKDLAPRDVVARGIHKEMLDKGTTNVYLDLKSNISVNRIKKHFPNILEKCLEFGVDVLTDLVPVVPAAHYFCGGIWSDLNGQTTVKDLYAVGEVACTGVHGANRLASTSLLEGLVWGKRAADHIQAYIQSSKKQDVHSIPPWEDTGKIPPDLALISQDMISIKHIMWNYVGLARSRERLRRAIFDLRSLGFQVEQFYGDAKLTDELIGLRNAMRAALLVTAAAWQNKRSVGCHYRED